MKTAWSQEPELVTMKPENICMSVTTKLTGKVKQREKVIYKVKIDLVKTFPENVKALIAYYAMQNKEADNIQQLTAALKYQTIKKAGEALCEKWLLNKELLDQAPGISLLSLSYLRLGNKVLFASGFVSTNIVHLFEENTEGRMVFLQTLYNIRLPEEPVSPEEFIDRIRKENNASPRK